MIRKKKIDLLPCPFCGGKEVEEKIVAGIHMFTCKNIVCGATVSFNNDNANYFPSVAALYWNERKGGE